MLHLTNGDRAVPLLSRFPGQVLPWRDVLHEGPVRAGLSLEALSEERARFIADAGWGSFPDVLAQFRARDAVLRKSHVHEEVVLWFEHDLYDQLQLLQLLDWFARHPHPRLSLICEAEYLGLMTPARAAELFGVRREVSAEMLNRASSAWAAYTSPDPSAISTRTDATLPFLGAAMRRLLEEYPWTTDGLSRLQRGIIAGRVEEDPMFLGDTVLEWHRKRLREGRWLPRWLGGVRVDESCPWRWDPALACLVTP